MIASPFLLFLQLASTAAPPPDVRYQSLVSAVRYEHVMEMKGEGGPGMTADSAPPKQAKSRLATVYANGNLRVDLLETSAQSPGAIGKSSYILSRNGGKEQYMVDTVKREYYALDTDSILSKAVGTKDPVAELGIKVSGVNVSVDEVGAGERFLGYATRHWRTRYQMTLSAALFGDSVSATADITDDSYYSHDVPFPANPIMRRDAMLVTPLANLIPGTESAKVTAAYAKLPKTAPLKSTARISLAFGPMEITLVSTDEITKIEQVNVPASFFEIPAGFKKVDPPVPELPKPPAQ